MTNDWVLSRLDRFYPIHRLAFARLLNVLRRDFDGDLDAMLVLLTLSLGTQRANWRGALLEGADSSAPTRLTNTASIAEATGIPRESVRRKLQWMESKGWIVRDENNQWAPTARAAEDLRDGTMETVNFIRAIGAAVIAEIDGPDDPGA
ncbi:MAG: hypothetical protein EP307_12690 [Rhodobacteraceae bacterium]|nr:MAG: hypothetical protein EP307_12690 [Paracoccaceae bacterium]